MTLISDATARAIRRLPFYEGDFRRAFSGLQTIAFNKLVKQGYAAIKIKDGMRLYTRTQKGSQAILHYHVEKEMRDQHAEFASPTFAHREPQL